MDDSGEEAQIAERWCKAKGLGWSVSGIAGVGGTASTFSLISPEGARALKIINNEFSTGRREKETANRISKQVSLGEHDCPYLIQTYDGGKFESRYFLLMNRAPGHELSTKLDSVPRSEIRGIVSQVATACAFLRSRNVAHRDIKSANLFISEDYKTTTLLDLSVLRDIYDPVGLGTDHDGQLPVVATSRYSPPEYLFRLEPPSAELWHALDIYQLGGVLHDLVMCEQMFHQEYSSSSENRYRFAWLVATREPVVNALDVDPDLLLLARRALDKDWRRRAQLSLDDFQMENRTLSSITLQLLGSKVGTQKPAETPKSALRTRLSSIVLDLEAQLAFRLSAMEIQATHRVEDVAELQKSIVLRWERPSGDGLEAASFSLRIDVEVLHPPIAIKISVVFEMVEGSDAIAKNVSLPDYADADGIESRIEQDLVQSFVEMASRLTREQSK
ncbi:serine/threonine-protein kinase [Mesorhizobium sp. M0018]|uniref:serine/threonine-protein kinase n=1 Tax=Mesorhizobium sp. M0018 TaxID=2956844 RepID=UPI00333974E7